MPTRVNVGAFARSVTNDVAVGCWTALDRGHGGGLGLALYGVVATLQPEANFGRIAAYGGIFIVGSLLLGMVFVGLRPDRWDLLGGAICLVGMAIIMYAPRG